MVTQEEKILNSMHMDLHSVRMLSNYKPTHFESKISYQLSLYFQDKCEGCKSVIDTKKIELDRMMRGDVPMQNKSFVDKILGK